MLSIILARLRRLRLLVQAALTSPRVRRNRRAVRISRQDKPTGAGLWRYSGQPTLRPTMWGRALALQPVRSRRR